MSNFDTSFAFKFTARGEQFAVVARTIVLVGGFSVDLLHFDPTTGDYLIVGNGYTSAVDPFSANGDVAKMGFKAWWDKIVAAINAALAKIFGSVPAGDPTTWDDFTKWIPQHLTVTDITLNTKP